MKRCTLLFAIGLGVSAAGAQPADLVVENARIWSDGLDGFAAFAAVRSGRFVHVGERDDALIGPDTERVDADGRVVIPGLIDSHVHMLGGGQQLARLNLRDAASREDFVARIAEWTSGLGEGEWVLGGRWSTESWPGGRANPTKEWVDPVTEGHPLYLPRMDGHSALVNSEALRRAGIDREGPPDPEGGVIDRDPATNEPTGILRESAMSLVSRLIPPESPESRVGALKRAMAHATRHGITAVADIPSIADLSTYEWLARDAVLTCRFFLYPTAEDWVRAADRAASFEGEAGWMEVRGFKAYFDGSLGSRTAYMREPFLGNRSHEPAWRGVLREGIADGTFMRNAAAARDASYQVIAHAIGDQANHLLLETLDAVFWDDLNSARCRSEHAQHLLPGDIGRFVQLGVIASMQPYHKADDGRYAEDFIGAERSRSSYAFRSLLDAGAVVCFGSDWPVVTIDPFKGIEAAVTGRTLDGKVWQPQECITVEEALKCYTSRGAYAMFAEQEIGRIAPGFRADFVILNRSPFDRDVDWSDIRPTRVFVEGRRVFVGGD